MKEIELLPYYILSPMGLKDLEFSYHMWGIDVRSVFREHFARSYYSSFVLNYKGQLAGLCQLIIFEKTAWFGMLITFEEHRNKGLGTKMMEFMLDQAKTKGCNQFMLFATPMGEPIYKKLGFVTDSTYNLYKKPEEAEFNYEHVYLAQQADYETILKIDRITTGEDRSAMLIHYLENAVVYRNQDGVEGFYLPDYGIGTIIALNLGVGENLLKYRFSNEQEYAVVPDDNVHICELLESWGFEKSHPTPRMVMGEPSKWKPNNIFCRGSGYAG